jgi:hypothetical protein
MIMKTRNHKTYKDTATSTQADFVSMSTWLERWQTIEENT